MVKLAVKNFFINHNQNNIPWYMQFPLYIFIIVFCSTLTWYFYKNNTLIPAAEKNLHTIMRSTETTIHSYLKTEEINASSLANLNETKSILEMTALHKQISQKDLDRFDARISKEQKYMDFKNILLIDHHKIICFSATDKQLIGQTLTQENTLLSVSYERAMMSLTPDFSEYGHDPLFKRPTLFITVPVIENKKFVGILAYECSMSSFSALTNQYAGLANTGEMVLAQKTDSFILFINQTRHDRDLAFKRKKISTKNPLSIQPSVLGKQGTGKAIDYRNVPVVGAWTFIPKINWGIIVKMDQAEVEQPLTLLLYLLAINAACILVWIIVIETLYEHPLHKKIKQLSQTSFIKGVPAQFKNYFFILLIISCSLLLKNCVHYYYKESAFSSNEIQNIISDIQDGVNGINQILNKIAFTTTSIADDLQVNRLSKDDITKRLKRDLAENENIVGITVAFAPYSYDPTIRLYAPSMQKEGKTYKEMMLEDVYDYTNTNPQDTTTAWYRNAIKEQQGVWISPSKDPKGNNIAPTYSYPFFDNNKQIQGIVCTTFKLDAIERITAYSSLDRQGYSVLLSENGTFLAHPIREFSESQKTLLDYAQENDSQALATTAQNIPHTTPQLSSYSLQSNHLPMWIYTEPIPANAWTLAALFSKEDIGLPVEIIRHYHFWILFYTLLSLIIACAYACSLEKISFMLFVMMINIILSLGLISAWYSIQTTFAIKTPNSTIITDAASLDNFLEDLQEEATRKNEEQPIKIPCGLLLYSVGMVQPKEMVISGYLWNKYNLTEHTDISHTMQIPHAIKLMKDSPTTSVANNWETVAWNIRGTIFQKQNYALYPFDKQQLQITLEHHDIEKNIILIPDLENYKKISPEDTPGLDKNFTVTGSRVEKAFFTYKKIDPTVNFGFSEYGKITDHFLLVYNLIIRRNLLNPFVLFFLPFLVILFSIFSVLFVSRKDSNPLSIISAYTGLCFTLVVLQRSLREQYPTNTTLYMEYAFFFAYISIIFLVIHTMLVYIYPQWNYYQNRVFPLIKFLFWPLHLASWLITTLIVFY